MLGARTHASKTSSKNPRTTKAIVFLPVFTKSFPVPNTTRQTACLHRQLRSLRAHRPPPINSFEQHRKLRPALRTLSHSSLAATEVFLAQVSSKKDTTHRHRTIEL
jgi:hypothetical protein